MNNDNIYGFTSTEEVKYDAQGLPVGQHKVMIIGEEPDSKGRGVVAEFEIVVGQHKGKKSKVWLMTRFVDFGDYDRQDPAAVAKAQQTQNIAQQNVKRIADATGRAVSATSPLKGRVLQVAVGTQKNDESRTEIKKYLPENAEAPTPF